MSDKVRALTFETYGGELRIRLEVTLDTGVHIGAGKDPLDPATPDSPVVRDLSGKPYLPGSSIKGAWRSHVERVVRTVGAGTPEQPGKTSSSQRSWIESLWSCDPLAEPCIPPASAGGKRSSIQDLRKAAKKAGKEKASAKPEAGASGLEVHTAEAWTDMELTKAIVKESCDVCLLFGSSWMASRVSIRDAVLSQTWQQAVASSPGGFPYEQRHGVGLDRDTGTAKDGILYQFEVVPPQVFFETEVVARDLAPIQRQLLCVALLELLDGRVELGGKTSRGLGKVRVTATRLEETTRDGLLDRLLDGKPRTVEGDEAIRAELRDGVAAKTRA